MTFDLQLWLKVTGSLRHCGILDEQNIFTLVPDSRLKGSVTSPNVMSQFAVFTTCNTRLSCERDFNFLAHHFIAISALFVFLYAVICQLAVCCVSVCLLLCHLLQSLHSLRRTYSPVVHPMLECYYVYVKCSSSTIILV